MFATYVFKQTKMKDLCFEAKLTNSRFFIISFEIISLYELCYRLILVIELL